MIKNIFKEREIRSPLSSPEIKAVLQGCAEKFKHYDQVIDVPLDGRPIILFETCYKVESLEDHSAELERTPRWWNGQPEKSMQISLAWSEGEDGTVIRYRIRRAAPDWPILLILITIFTFVHTRPPGVFFSLSGLIVSLFICGLSLIARWTQRNHENRRFLSWTRFSFQTHPIPSDNFISWVRKIFERI